MQLLFLLRHLQHIPCPPQKAYPCRGAQPGQLLRMLEMCTHTTLQSTSLSQPHTWESSWLVVTTKPGRSMSISRIWNSRPLRLWLFPCQLSS